MRNSELSWQYKNTEKSRLGNLMLKIYFVFLVTDLLGAINLTNRLDFFS